MSKITNTWSHEKGKCCITGESTDNTLRLNMNEGFCQSSTTIYVKPNLVDKKYIGDNLFVFINNQVFWEVNGFDNDVISPVRNAQHFSYLVHEEERKIIRECKFSDDY